MIVGHFVEVCGRKVTGVIRARQEELLLPVLMYGGETMTWKERSRFRAV